MTIERRLARAGFTVTRYYPVPLERVWDAFAKEDQKPDWFGAGDTFEPGEWAFDLRVGGRDIAEGDVSRRSSPDVRGHVHPHRRARPHRHDVRHVAPWGPHVHGSGVVRVHTDRRRTRFTQVEYGVFFDKLCADRPNREKGSRGPLEAMGNVTGHVLLSLLDGLV